MHISTGVTKGRSHGDSTYPWEIPLASLVKDGPKDFGCTGTSIGVTKRRWTQGWGVCGHLH